MLLFGRVALKSDTLKQDSARLLGDIEISPPTRDTHKSHGISDTPGSFLQNDPALEMLVAAVVLTRLHSSGKTQAFASVNTVSSLWHMSQNSLLSPRFDSYCRSYPDCLFSHESRPSFGCLDHINKQRRAHAQRQHTESHKLSRMCCIRSGCFWLIAPRGALDNWFCDTAFNSRWFTHSVHYVVQVTRLTNSLLFCLCLQYARASPTV